MVCECVCVFNMVKHAITISYNRRNNAISVCGVRCCIKHYKIVEFLFLFFWVSFLIRYNLNCRTIFSAYEIHVTHFRLTSLHSICTHIYRCAKWCSFINWLLSLSLTHSHSLCLCFFLHKFSTGTEESGELEKVHFLIKKRIFYAVLTIFHENPQ